MRGIDGAVSVVICAYTDRRWALLSKTIDSVRSQRGGVPEILLVVDHNPELLARARAAFRGARVLANEEARGLSGARNTGVRHSGGEVIAFLDDDAPAHSDWLEKLLAVFAAPIVMGAGGAACAVWEDGRPGWLPEEFLWVVGASYEGLPRETRDVRNPIGANMAFRREAFERVGGFTDGIGRIGHTPLGCEETEFSIRLHQTVPGARVLYVPEAKVDHHVSADRCTLRYFLSRCWAEGASKALVAAKVGADDALSSERAYVSRTLPAGVLSGLRPALGGDRAGLARAAAIVVGAGVTAAGFIRGRLTSGRAKRDRSRKREAVLRGLLELAAKAPAGRRGVFELYHRVNVWGGRHSRSGTGSDLEQTAVLRAELPGLLRRLGVSSLADVPCGDLTWMRHVDLPVERYVGIDIVPALIDDLRREPPIPNADFRCVDVVSRPVPAVDAVFSRDLLVHLSFEEIWSVLRNFRASGARWLITTTFPGRANVDIRAGLWRPLDLQAPPFGFPPPDELIVEECTENQGTYSDKTIGVWDFETLDLGP